MKSIVLVLLCLTGYSFQQTWNEKVLKQWDTTLEQTLTPTPEPTQPQVASRQPEQEQTPKSIQIQPAPVFFQPPAPQILQPTGPYVIQQQTVTNTGETIVENLIGGVPFDCTIRPTGHWRDGKYCDLFHACVFGSQRKTYACPFVGERSYFDEVTRRCEFVRSNPLACQTNIFYH